MPQTPEQKAKAARNYQANKEYYQNYAKEWWKAHPDKLRAKWRRAAAKRRGKRLIYFKERRLKDVERFRKKNREWQKKQWAHRQAYMRKYYEKNKEKIREKTRQWNRAHLSELWLRGKKRRALLMQASANLKGIKTFVDSVRAKKFAWCYYCQKKVSTSGIHFDHIIPLSKGGQHSVENLCVTCSPCNLSKHAKPLSRWNKHPQLFLSL